MESIVSYPIRGQGGNRKWRGKYLLDDNYLCLLRYHFTVVVTINQGEQPLSFEEEIAQDVLENITVFSARRYGNRGHKNHKLVETLREAAERL